MLPLTCCPRLTITVWLFSAASGSSTHLQNSRGSQEEPRACVPSPHQVPLAGGWTSESNPGGWPRGQVQPGAKEPLLWGVWRGGESSVRLCCRSVLFWWRQRSHSGRHALFFGSHSLAAAPTTAPRPSLMWCGQWRRWRSWSCSAFATTWGRKSTTAPP